MPHKKFIKDIGIIGITNMAMALKGLLILPIITKFLGAEKFGVWAQLVIIVSLITPITTLGLHYTLVRFLAGEKDKEKIQDGIYSVLFFIFAINIIAAIFLYLLAPFFSFILGFDPVLVRILSIIILLECLNLVFLNVFRAFQKIKRYAFFIIFQGFGEVSLVFWAVFAGYGLLGAVISLLIIRIINFLITGAMILKEFGLVVPRFLKIKQYLRFGIPTIPSNISSWFVHFIDRYLIGYFLGSLFVGYYVPAYILGSVIAFWEAPFSFLLPSALSKLYDENKINEVKNYLKYSLKYFLIIAIPSLFGLSLLSKQLLNILSTREIADQGYLIVPFMATSMIFWGIYGIISQIIILVKKTSVLGKIWIIATIINLLLNILFIPKFGIMAAGAVTLLTYTVILVLSFYYSFKELAFEIDWKSIIKIIVSSAIMSILLFWLNPIGLNKTLFAIISGSALYAVILFLSKIFEEKEIFFFKNLLKLN